MSEIVTIKHSINSGDSLANLAGLQHIYNKIGKKSVFMQRLNLPGTYYSGCDHPVKTEDGIQVTMNEKQWNLLRPLIEAQPYIERAEIWEGQKSDIDLDVIRYNDFSPMPIGDLARWTWYAHPLLACDLSEKWLHVPKLEDNSFIKDKIILNFTSRYRNDLINYKFLKEFENICVFAGTKDEHEMFCKQNELIIPYLEVKDFLQLAQYINECKFFTGNQSMCWWISDALKVKRILEVCWEAPNCPPHGADGYDFLHQDALEIYFNKLNK